jgi:hypothetical protein
LAEAMRRLALVVVSMALVTGVSAAAGVAARPLSHWLSWSANRHSARLLLVAGYDSTNNGFNFDGYARGRLLFRVPRGWRVTILCKNAGSRNHSCAVVHGAGATRLAFRGAAIPDPVRGIPPGKAASFTFVPSRVGVYRLVCLVPGHELAREYDVLKVVASGRPGVTMLSSIPG